MTDPELLVENLKVSFATQEGELTAVNEITYHLNREETIGHCWRIGLRKNRERSFHPALDPLTSWNDRIRKHPFRLSKDLSTNYPLKNLGEIRGRDIAMVFQDPMTSLNPVLTLGDQIMEPHSQAHSVVKKSKPGKKRWKFCNRVEIPSPAGKNESISASVERRHAATSDDRHGPVLLPKNTDRGRTHNRTRRPHSGADRIDLLATHSKNKRGCRFF